MKAKRLLLVILSVLICLSAVSCKEQTKDTEESIADGSTEAVSPYLDLFDGGKGVDVIYSPDASSATMEIAMNLAKRLTRIGNVEYEASPLIHEPDPDKTEIFVANVGCDEDKQAYADLGYGESKVCVIGNKAVVCGFDNESLKAAVETLLLSAKECKDENGGLRVERTLLKTQTVISAVSELPVLENAVPESITNTGEGCYMLTFKNVEKTDADAYREALVAKGYSLCAPNVIENNEFYTYTDQTRALTVMYLANTKTAKVLIEPIANVDLSILKQNEGYVKGNEEITFTQLGVAYADEASGNIAEYYTSGMSYVMKLDDGSFIVIDGGYDKQGDADRLYELMKKQSGGEENITVAAWIFTHAHSDHSEVIIKFARGYADKVSVERFIYNFPGSGQIGNHSDSAPKVIGTLDAYYKDVPRIKAHAGQKLYIRSAVIEMLYTLEVSADQLKNYNNSSLVFTVKAEGKQIMMLGDYSETAPMLLKLYTAATLKSDVVQVAHHGISDGSNLLNRAIEAEYALWPVVALQLKTYWQTNPKNIDLSTYGFNSYFMNMAQDKVFVAGDDVVVITLAGDITATAYDNFEAYQQGTAKGA